MLEEIGATSKKKVKHAIIEAHKDDPFFRETIVAALDPYKMYKLGGCVSYKQISIMSCPEGSKYTARSVHNVFAKLADLAQARGASLNDKMELSWLAACDQDTIKVVNRILKKDLRCGAAVKTFKEFFPEIPDHSVMLCDHDVPKFKKLCGDDPSLCLVSTKLDGVRTWAVVTNTINYLSRNGETYSNFRLFDQELTALYYDIADMIRDFMPEYVTSKINITFDGECIAEDRDFDSFCGNARKSRSLPDTTKFRYNIFDVIVYCDDKMIPQTLEDRIAMLRAAFEHCDTALTIFVDHSHIQSWDDLPKLVEERLAAGEEGIILKYAKGTYVFDRTPEWCKMKRRDIAHDTLDLPVVGMQEGTGNFAGMMGALICEHKGTKVKVGTGFSVAQRQLYYDCPPKMIEVDFQEETKSGSLRFPVFVKDRTHDKYVPEDTPEDL